MLSQYEHLINRYHFKFMDDRMGPYGISGPLGFYLVEIEKHKSLKMNQLIDLTPYHKSHATRIVAKLTEMGLVDKSVDPEDMRGYILTITKQGIEIAQKVFSAHQDWETLVDSALSKEESNILESLMEKTYLHLKKHFGEDCK